MKCETQNTPNYYAVIPAEVRYCKDLEPNAKLLYGEISALCNQEGYCWATNRHFSTLYDVSNRSVQNWLESLKKNNFIVIENSEGDFNTQRKIYLSHAYQISVTRKNLHGTVKKSSCKGEKNCTHNTTSNNTSNNLPPSVPIKKEPLPKKKSLRSEGEVPFIYEFLEGTKLSPREKQRLSRDYTKEEVLRALKISEKQKIKKTLMHLLSNILKNPENWEDPEEMQLETDSEHKALQYNKPLKENKKLYCEPVMKPGEKQRKIYTAEEIANENEQTIKKGYMKIILDGFIQQVSLNSSDFEQDIKTATAQLR